jgi:hypothetical protein
MPSFDHAVWHQLLFRDSSLQQFDYSDLHFVVREFDSVEEKKIFNEK